MDLDRKSKIEALEAFERRYPIAGQTVHALIDTYGGIEPFILDLERQGFGGELHGWVTARREGAMKMPELRHLIDHERIEEAARKSGTNSDSVEIQLAQYLPRLFKTLGENLDGMEFLWSSHSSHSGRTPPTQH